MVEVLVAIIIMSFGLLGMVGLQAAALKGNREARLQSVAAGLARELAEMMRGNKDVGLATGASNPYLVAIAVGGSFQPTTPSYCLNAGGTGCSTALALAQARMTEWLTRVNTELPGARVTVCLDSAPYDSGGLPVWACTAGSGNDIVIIKMGWTRSSTNRAATAASAIESATTAKPGLVYPVTAGSTL